MLSLLSWGLIVLTVFIGASLGSFLNVVIWRVPEGMSIVTPPSHCPKCNSPIRWFDNIPILSWFLLRGKCRRCGQSISFRYPLVESLSAVASLTAICGVLYNQGFNHESLFFSLFSDFGSAIATSQNLICANEPAELLHCYIEDYTNLLWKSFICSLSWTIFLDMILMIGLILYDRKTPPTSLSVCTLIILALIFSLFVYMNDNTSLCRQITTYWGSGILGMLPMILKSKAPNSSATRLIGFMGGIGLGLYLALPVMAVCQLLSYILGRIYSKNYLGLIVFAAVSLSSLFILK
ncbi:MAG: prepilin peptidase [Thermoguttaceae bacterium]|nr:prepilin peptidase [Thermoguttaceae bacterium]